MLHGVEAAHQWSQVKVTAMLDLFRAHDLVHRLTIHSLNHQFVNVRLPHDHLVDMKRPDLLHVLVQDRETTDVSDGHVHRKSESDIDRAAVIHDIVDEGTVFDEGNDIFLDFPAVMVAFFGGVNLPILLVLIRCRTDWEVTLNIILLIDTFGSEKIRTAETL